MTTSAILQILAAVLPRRVAGAGLALVTFAPAALVSAPRSAAAQLPGLPVLQNGFSRPGFGAAVNIGSGDETTAVAAAGAWTPASGRYQLSFGLGILQPPGNASSRAAGGARIAALLPTPWTGEPTSAFGLAAFGGLGGAWEDEGGVLQLPVGVGLGYRRAIGETRAASLYVTPFFNWIRRTGGEETDEDDANDDSNLFRTSVGLDFTVTRTIGLTVGYEFGSNAEAGRPGPRGGIFGVGLSYAF